jgi:Protein of unknown function (DUF1588)/Protein of unknown function (DUF1592)/Protein of unknown function (DUF1585)
MYCPFGLRTTTALISLALAVGGIGCSGEIGAGNRTPGGAGPNGGTTQGTGGPIGSTVDPAVLAALPWPIQTGGTPSALRRLTRDELVTSLEMLTGSAPPRTELPEEQRSGHGPLLTAGVAFIGPEMGRLKLALDNFAAKIAPSMLAKTGCALTQQAQRDCLLAWSLKFAEQSLRRPARTGESTAFQKILSGADGTAEADTGALEGVLTAIFFAPSFLYRTEIGTPVTGNDALRALSTNELASRLSYLASLAPPDAELMSAAQGGRLQDGAERVKQFDRLSQTPFGKRAQAVFVLEWLGGNEPKINQKSVQYVTGLTADFETAIRASADAFIQKVLSSATPTLANLLSTDSYLADAAIQQITRPGSGAVTPTGDGAVAGRTGLLMHPQIIAAHTKENGSSPFQIGVAMREDLLCDPVPPPPPNAQAMAKTDPPAGLSLRENLDYRTSAGAVCSSCHSSFKELGYTFLPFDPVGRWMQNDPSGKPWDLSGNVSTYSGVPLKFSSPSELAKNLGTHPQAQGCFAQVALEWSLGRALTTEDQHLAVAVSDVAKSTGGNVSAILRAIVAAPEFTNAVASR